MNAEEFARITETWNVTVPIGSVQYHMDMMQLTDYLNQMCDKGESIIRESDKEQVIIAICRVAVAVSGKSILSPIVGDNPESAPDESINAIMTALVGTVTAVVGSIVTEGMFDSKPLDLDDITRSLNDGNGKQD